MATALSRLSDHAAFRLCLVVWCFGYLLVAISMLAQGRLASPAAILSFAPLLALGVGQSMALAWLLDRLEARVPALKWPAMIVAILAVALVQTTADHFINMALALTLIPEWRSWALGSDPRDLAIIMILYGWTVALSVALIWSTRIGDVARLNEARAAAFEAAASRAEAAALRLQLNPHFMFNTLNGIASLVVRGRSAQAEEMIGRLAEFMRSSLAADPMADIPLEQELATVRAYLHVEEARFGDRMQVHYRIEEETLGLKVPNFLLQPLIENAVKHGIARSRRGGIIEVAARREGGELLLSVLNRKVAAGRAAEADLPALSRDRGLGLANTRQRLHSLYGDKASVDNEAIAGGWSCRIRLPATPAESRSSRLAAE